MLIWRIDMIKWLNLYVKFWEDLDSFYTNCSSPGVAPRHLSHPAAAASKDLYLRIDPGNSEIQFFNGFIRSFRMGDDFWDIHQSFGAFWRILNLRNDECFFFNSPYIVVCRPITHLHHWQGGWPLPIYRLLTMAQISKWPAGSLHKLKIYVLCSCLW